MIDEEDEERGLLEDERFRQRQAADLEEVLALAGGRRTLWRLLEYAGIFRSVFNTDPYATAFNEGRRSTGLFLLGEIERASPGVLGAMMKEHVNER